MQNVPQWKKTLRMVIEEYTWDYVKQLLKIDIQKSETDTHYKIVVYIPCFDSKCGITYCKKDYYQDWVWYDATPEESISRIIIKSFNLEAWLGVKIRDYREKKEII
jgi:hypothetical protein